RRAGPDGSGPALRRVCHRWPSPSSDTMAGCSSTSGTDPGTADPAALDDVGRLVGAWRLDRRGLAPDGTWHRAAGELHVGWVLGRRAVEGVWIVPGRGEPGAGVPPLAFHGTTVRFLRGAAR
ncbi:hypothetical protein, partial [Geodermatophilus sp. SYSU D01176]